MGGNGLRYAPPGDLAPGVRSGLLGALVTGPAPGRTVSHARVPAAISVQAAASQPVKAAFGSVSHGSLRHGTALR